MSLTIELAERAIAPDWLVRRGIRRLLHRRLRDESAGDPATRRAAQQKLIADWCSGPVAIAQREANRQHYEVPAAFFERMLGPWLKYSSCLWPEGIDDLAAAEEAMLDLTCRRAEIADGQQILELGCGWGSLSLWMATRYPRARITAVSNSRTQREFILARAAERGLNNVEVLTRDIADFAIDRQFDRVVSVEMFEHVRNHEELLRRIAGWLRPDGKLFVHIFCHRELAYPFETEGDDNWMGRHFFTGGVMPSYDLLPGYHRDLRLEERWRVSGIDYSRTLEAWLLRLDAQRGELRALFRDAGEPDPDRALQRWRVFLLACSELFAYRGGNEWHVAHYRFAKPA